VSREALVAAFARFPDRVAVAANAAADRRVPAGEWGPAEVVRHLIAVEAEVWQSRLARVAAEDDPHWPWTEPGLASGFDDASLAQVLAAFAAARATTVATIRALDDAGWSRSGTHTTYGRLDIEGLLRIAVDHDESHLEGLGIGDRPVADRGAAGSADAG
jgi:DinB superfamily